MWKLKETTFTLSTALLLEFNNEIKNHMIIHFVTIEIIQLIKDGNNSQVK